MDGNSSNNDYDDKTRTLIQGMVEAEEKAIAKRKKQAAPEEECECRDGMFPNGKNPPIASRRQFLAATASGAAALALAVQSMLRFLLAQWITLFRMIQAKYKAD